MPIALARETSKRVSLMKKVVPIVSKILSVSLVLSIAGCSDRFESRYASLTEAEKKGALERGWIPDSLSESTFGIVEVHDTDTNEVWGAFQFQPRESPFSSPGIGATSSDAQRDLRSPEIGWWPTLLIAPFDEMKISQAGFKLYTNSTNSFYFAINQSEGKGYFWSPAN